MSSFKALPFAMFAMTVVATGAHAASVVTVNYNPSAPTTNFTSPTNGSMRWSRLFGQFGGEVKLIPGFDHAASWSVSVAGACPGNGRFSFAP